MDIRTHTHTRAASHGKQPRRPAANTEEDHSNAQQRLNTASGNYVNCAEIKTSSAPYLCSAVNLYTSHLQLIWIHGREQEGWSTVGTTRLVPAGSAVVALLGWECAQAPGRWYWPWGVCPHILSTSKPYSLGGTQRRAPAGEEMKVGQVRQSDSNGRS